MPTTAPAPQAAQTQTTETPTTPAQPQTAQGAATSGSQVATVVNTEFPSYDKDSNGSLSEVEFASWMVALKSASDPATKADSADTKAWVNQAFAAADKDKSKSVSKDELTGFLSQNAS